MLGLVLLGGHYPNDEYLKMEEAAAQELIVGI